MELRKIIVDLPLKEWLGPKDMDITDICYRSDKVTEGALFVAIKGMVANGHDYIPDALNRGAKAVIVEEDIELPKNIARLTVMDSRKALAAAGANFYRHPSRELALVGITGTNGKTTTAFLLESIFKESGYRPGVISTINVRFSGQESKSGLTTPESLDLHRLLREMVEAGVNYAVMEVSSHALVLDRIGGCDFTAAAFTNLTRDHLDFHGNMEEYSAAKRLLFSKVLTGSRPGRKRAAVVNLDDPKGLEMASGWEGETLCFSLSNQEAEVHPLSHELTLDGIEASIATPMGTIQINSTLIGSFNLSNILGATAVALALDLPLSSIGAGIAALQCVPGRLERISNPEGITVLVDYAHTPDALSNALSTVAALTPKRLITVFGCGGDRDRGKRPEMGRAAVEYSDLAIITSDNPRSENPLDIIEAIIEGSSTTGMPRLKTDELSGAGKGYAVEPDRRTAIRTAVLAAKPGDAVLIAGKGHEDYQILGKITTHFDDREEAGKALAMR